MVEVWCWCWWLEVEVEGNSAETAGASARDRDIPGTRVERLSLLCSVALPVACFKRAANGEM